MFKCKKLFSSLLLGLIIINIIPIPVYATSSYPDVFAEYAILMDAKTGKVLYGKNEHKRAYPASITKLLTALVAMENLRPTDTITMSKDAVFSIERNSSNIWLDVDEQITLDQGLHALLLASANDAANGIAELSHGSIEAFAKYSTQHAKELGAKNTNFVNPHGLHDSNHYTTAYDMALISKEILNQPYFREIMDTHTYQIPATNRCDEIRYLSQPHKLLNQQRFGKLAREDVIGGKTGYTTDAGNTLVTMAKRDDIELIAVILKSNSQNLYKDTNILLDYGFDNYKSISLHQSENIIDSLPLYNIKSGQLIHVADADICVEECVNLLASTEIKERMIDPTIILPDRLDNGISVGDVVGTISYSYEDETLITRNLIVKNVNYIDAPVPTIFTASPKYPGPAFIPANLPLLSMGLAVFIAFAGLILISFYKSRRNSKLQRRKNRILKFSKTIK